MAQAQAKLPKKEAEIFRTVVSCYESKQYKKGVKAADSILKKFPNSGETQAMKGLLLNCMGKKEEAYELVKLGLRNDVRSHVCWHVYGLLYRSDNNYKEAIKCYLNALRIDKDNQNILRDLSNLQIQMRDMSGFLSTRRRILEGRPTLRASWVAFALANFAVKDYDVAFDAVSKYYETSIEQVEPYDDSEFLLFQNLCLEKAGKYEQAIEHLEKEKAKIVDKLSLRIKMGQLYLLTGRFAEARTHWETMVGEQPENYRFHNLLQAALLELTGDALHRVLGLKRLETVATTVTLTEAQRNVLLTYYTDSAIPKSRAFNRLRLFLLQGSASFSETLEALIRSATDSGIPSLCQDIMALMVIPQPSNPLVSIPVSDAYDIVRHPTMQIALEITGRLLSGCSSSSSSTASDGAGTALLSPSSELWLWFLQAHLQWKCGHLDAAMASIEQAIAHTPTALDMYTFKAKLFKAQGDFQAAAECMDQCRSLDLQDRYLNNKATKYFLKNDDFEAAAQTIAMFTKHDSEGDVQRTLYDLQCSWYELEVADCFARQHKWSLALKKFTGVRQHFLDQYDDIFDFHAYCLRKTTLRAYVDELTTLDASFVHKRYQRALQGALKIYLHFLDCPEDVDGLGHLSAAERKKERARVKKMREKEAADRAKLREEQKEKDAAAASASASAGKDGKEAEDKEDKKDDSDPYGESFITNKDFLHEANLWCSALFHYSPAAAISSSSSSTTNNNNNNNTTAAAEDEEIVVVGADGNIQLDYFPHNTTSMNTTTTNTASAEAEEEQQSTLPASKQQQQQETQHDLLSFASAETLALVAEVQMRRGHYLKALRALSLGVRQDAFHGDVFLSVMKLALKTKNKKLGTSQALLPPVIKSEIARFLSQMTHTSLSPDTLFAQNQHLTAVIDQYLTAATSSSSSSSSSSTNVGGYMFTVYLAAMKALVLVEKNTEVVSAQMENWVMQKMLVVEDLLCVTKGVSYESVADVGEFLRQHFPTASFTEAFFQFARRRYAHGKLFQLAGASSQQGGRQKEDEGKEVVESGGDA